MDKLKPAWQQYKLQHAHNSMEKEAMLALLEEPREWRYSLSKLTLMNGLLLSFMMICCQGG